VAAAESLLSTQTKKVNERHQNIEARLDQLEKGSVESARLLQEMAEQLQALTLAQQETQKRVRVVVVLGTMATVLGVAAVILAIVT
jgi:dsDNA-specific endonuclease/ATPase MutS2